jgi:molecular chaperone HtpG
VRVTARLTESPACLVVGDHDMGVQMRRIMQAAGQQVPDANRSWNSTPITRWSSGSTREPDEDRFATLAMILFEQAQLASGDDLEDPAAYVQRLNRLLLELSGA